MWETYAKIIPHIHLPDTNTTLPQKYLRKQTFWARDIAAACKLTAKLN